ncbi:MAG: DegQ family serine endoprotease [Rhodospirillales bacterium]
MKLELSYPRRQPDRLPQRGQWRGRLGAGLLAMGLSGLIVASPYPLAVSPAVARVAPDSFADLAQQLLPSVVNISTTQTVEGSGIELPKLPPGSPFEEFFKEFMEKNQPRQQKHKATSLGSGYIIDAKGYIVTNNHVIQDAEEITVILQDETRLPAKMVGRDAKTDIAVLKVDPGNLALPAVKFGDSNAIRVGDWIVAIGNPFGFGGTVTAGIISARGRNINAGPYDDFLQTDASINRGNSGGPMFNLAGEVIGMATAIFSPSGGSIGIGFAIPSSTVKPVIQQLIDHGEVRRGWLGVRIQQVNEEIAEALGLSSPTGALVASVIPGGPAEKAKIKDGDVILEFDGKPVDQMRRLPRAVADTEVGKTVPVKIWRAGKEMTLKVEVAALKEEDEEKQAAAPQSGEKSKGGESIDDLGVTVAAIDAQMRDRFDLGDDAKGLVVTEVNPDGPAAEQGLRPGETIVEIGQENVSTPAQLAEKVKAAKGLGRKSVLLLVEGEGGLRFVAVRIGAKG